MYGKGNFDIWVIGGIECVVQQFGLFLGMYGEW